MLLVALVLFAQVGNPIVSPPPVPAPNNITVNMTAPPPDPVATAQMNQYLVSNTEYDTASVPVTWATALLAGTNIWTNTPEGAFSDLVAARLRGNARNAAIGLFLLGVLWTGVQLALGSGLGTTTYQQLLPLVIAGFLLAVYSETIIFRSVALCNWLNAQLGDPSLGDFSGTALELPTRPTFTPDGVLHIVEGFLSGLIGSAIYAIVLVILELKLIFREAILMIGSTVMPISGVLFAFGLTKTWGVQLFRLYFGWLFGQPLVVVCLALAGSLLTLMNLTDSVVTWLVKVAVLFAALKMVSFLSGAGLGGGGMFGIAGLLFLLRRAQTMARGSGAAATTSTSPTPAAAVQGGQSGGTGQGSAATGRPWRPAFGTA